MIIPVSLAAISIFMGYVVMAGILLGATLGMASASPGFVEANFCLRTPYKLVHAGLWLACTVAGALVTAWMGDPGWAWLEGVVLMGALITVLWQNTWEARQRGLPYQILLTALTPIGVWLGYVVRHTLSS